MLGAVLAFISGLSRAFWRSTERLAPREEAHLALLTIRQYIVDMAQCKVSADGSSLTFTGPAGQGEISFEATGRRLMFRPPGRTQVQPLISGNLVKISFLIVRRGVLRIELEVERGPAPERMKPLGLLKMTDQVLAPCIASRDTPIPWTTVIEATGE